MQGKKRINRIFTFSVWTLALAAAAGMLLPVFLLLRDALFTLLRGWSVLPGIGRVVANTLKVLGMVLLWTVPVSLGAALWMVEFASPRALGAARRLITSLSIFPAVLVGLVAHWLLRRVDNNSLWPVALVLSVLMVPFLVLRFEGALCSVPRRVRQTGLLLGGSRLTVLLWLVLPQAAPELMRSVVMCVERILGEATALLVMLGTVMSGSMLSIELFRLAWMDRKDAAVLALLLALCLIGLRCMTAARWDGREEGEECQRDWWWRR